mmetsp:Transcript_15908/g.41096  ORF Transcript_15908/g.41096 Transcript_15908/m.41096 type:complete len:211 (+) Transcript_15908:345-977(+)
MHRLSHLARAQWSGPAASTHILRTSQTAAPQDTRQDTRASSGAAPLVPAYAVGHVNEGMLKQPRGPKTILHFPCHAEADEGTALRAHRVRDRRRLPRVADVVHSEHEVVEGGIAPRLLCRSHFDDSAAKTPDVSLAPMSIQLKNDLWRHPRDAAHGREGLRHSVPLGAPKVGKLHIEVQVHKDVCTLNVAVNHRRASRMQVVQPLDDAPG